MLEKLTNCRGGSSPMQFNIKSANMTKNRFTVDGDAIVSESQNKDLQVILKYRRCEMKKDKKCGGMVDYVLPKVCNLVSDTGVFGIKVGNAFAPKWECPVKANKYKIQMNVSLKGIIRIPLSNLRYETKLIFQDAGKKKQVGCVEGVWWLKDLKNS